MLQQQQAGSSPLPGKQHAKRIDLESASTEVIVREAKLLEQKAEESMERVRKESEKVPLIMKDV
ncbi:hypothetical protein BRADI_1g52120v3 [Brachypodium distachyon]|uniref:Uncharacterized protein n=1 Tax=Brachypodium distachyon TaxID=15368 RepID=I1H205_BRADI|nr:hypothetical protein BRADI_1g52120v3 [Brachypodium distachyon]